MKKINFSIITILFINSFLLAQTNIPGGEVSGTWTKANSPYLIQGAIMIANDSTLTIEPGVSVIFQGGYKFLILGRLLALGTVSDTITFTAADTAMGWRGIRFDNTPATNDSSKIFYCKLTNGKANGSGEDVNGGALYFRNFSKGIISNSYISNNSASYSGGGIYCYESNLTILNNIIFNNSASFSGGGIYCYTGNVIISNNNISKNAASSGGGILCDYSSPIIINNIIFNNNYIGIYCNQSSPLINNNTISYNYAFSGGIWGGVAGGIYIYFGSPTISNNTITNNSVFGDDVIGGGNGGGIFCDFDEGTIISNNIISFNSATYNGGGIFCSYSNPIISNNIISYNFAEQGGGIFYTEAGYVPTIVITSNNTISYNKALKGGALFCGYNSSPTFQNILLWGNTATTSGNQIYLDDESSDPNFYFCDMQGGKTGFGLNTNVFYLGTYSNNINADPLFVDTTSANWSLQSNSPCINAGDTSGTYPSTDIAGNPRICDGRIDIGAYEYQNGVCITDVVSMDKSEREISVFPNPTTGFFYLDTPNLDNQRILITVTNTLGIEILTMIYNDITTERFIKEINLSNFPNQIYIVKVEINGQVYLRKMCKIK